VFTDALVLAPAGICRASPQDILQDILLFFETPLTRAAGCSAFGCCAFAGHELSIRALCHGYRFAKRDGKSISAPGRKSLKNMNFSDFDGARAVLRSPSIHRDT
jgi:hypothetical protein